MPPSYYHGDRCDRCGGPLLRSEKLIPDLVVVGCKPCNRKRLDGDTQWYEGRGVVPLLIARAQDLAERERFRIFLEADARYDPRWTMISSG